VVNMAVVDGDFEVFERANKFDRGVVVMQGELFHPPHFTPP